MLPILAFDSASAVYPLYTSLLKVGVRPGDMDVGYFQRDAAHPELLGKRVGVGDTRLDEKEVVLFAAESFEKFSDPLSKWAGTSPPIALTEQRLTEAKTFITNLHKIVEPRFPNGSAAATEAMAYGCFVFLQFPTKADWDQLPASTQRTFITTHFPEIEKLGIGALASYLGQNGGLGNISLNWVTIFGEFDRPLDYLQASTGGMPNTSPFILHKLLAMAGLQSTHVQVLRSREPRKPCVNHYAIAYGEEIRWKGGLRVFVPGTPNDSHAERDRVVQMDATDIIGEIILIETVFSQHPKKNNREAITRWLTHNTHGFNAQMFGIKGADTKDAARQAAMPFTLLPLLSVVNLISNGQFPMAQQIRGQYASLGWFRDNEKTLVDLYLAQEMEDYLTANRIATQLSAAAPGCVVSYLFAIRSALMLGKIAEAEALIPKWATFLDRPHDEFKFSFLHAQVALRKRDWAKAKTLFQSAATAPTADLEDKRHARLGQAIANGHSPDDAGEVYFKEIETYIQLLRRNLAGASVKILQEERRQIEKYDQWGLWPNSTGNPDRFGEAKGDVWAAMGSLFQIAGDFDRARSCLEMAIAAAPHKREFRHMMATTWAEQGNWEKVKKEGAL